MTEELLPVMHPREFLSQYHLTYKEFARYLGVTSDAVQNWMSDRCNPSRQTQRQVAEFAARLKENGELRRAVLATECE